MTQGRPVQPVKVDVACTKCGGAMAVRRGRRGSFLGCTNYPKCRGTAPIPDELKDKLAEQAGPAAAPGRRLEGDPDRGNVRAMRRSHARSPSRRGFFLGCGQYPQCKGTRQPGEATLAKITEVMGV